MTMDRAEFCRRAGIDRALLTDWIDAGWLEPRRSFTEGDLARAMLIRDLTGPMAVNVHGVDVILRLLDQMHALRQALHGVTTAVSCQEVTVRESIRAEIGRIAGAPRGRSVRRAPPPGPGRSGERQ